MQTKKYIRKLTAQAKDKIQAEKNKKIDKYFNRLIKHIEKQIEKRARKGKEEVDICLDKYTPVARELMIKAAAEFEKRGYFVETTLGNTLRDGYHLTIYWLI